MNPVPVSIKLHKLSRILEIEFEDSRRFELSYEMLRVFSPSAEVRGHGPGQEVLQAGKKAVDILDIRPVGNYGIAPQFSDGHDSGIFTFDYLYELGVNRDALWQNYIYRLDAAGLER